MNQTREVIKIIINSIEKYLMVNEQNECMSTQHIAGLKHIFRGWVVKNWRDINKD